MDRHPYQMPCVPWAQRHHCEGKSQYGEISTCHVPTEVLSAQIVEARVMFPQGWQLWVWVPCQALAYHAGLPLPRLPPRPPWALPLAEGHNGNYYLLDVCLISSYSSWLAITVPGGLCPPLVSSLRGGSGKTISGEHLDHLFRAPGVSRKPNCPHLCGSVFPSFLSLQVGHECEPWKVHRAGCQRGSPQTNTNATWRSSCEQCESAKCMINWACQGGFMAVKHCGWSQALLWLWLFRIMGVDSVLLAAISARFIWAFCTNEQQKQCEREKIVSEYFWI